MWIFTQDAFLSVVAYDRNKGDPGQKIPGPAKQVLLVRARCKEDLLRVRRHHNLKFRIYTDDWADYRFRAYITRKALKQILAKEVDRLDYTNFKDRVTKTLGNKRHDVYLRVWGVMNALQPRRRSRLSGHPALVPTGNGATWDDIAEPFFREPLH